MNLSKAAKLVRVSNAVAAGTTTVNSASVDMQGFHGVAFAVEFGAITAGAATAIKLQGSHDGTAWDDLKNTSQTVADSADNKTFVADVMRPMHRYLRAVVSRATQNAAVDSILAIAYGADREPVALDPSVAGVELHLSPAAGTP